MSKASMRFDMAIDFLTGEDRDMKQALSWLEKTFESVESEDEVNELVDRLGEQKDVDAAFKSRFDELVSKFQMKAVDAMLENGDSEHAKPILLKRAEAGDANAQYRLGKLYEEEGEGEQAHEWISKAIANGSAEAKKEDDVFMQMTREQADKGDTDAMMMLARCLSCGRTLFGQSFEKDAPKAIDLFEKCFDEGETSAAMDLANIYFEKDNSVRDVGRGWMWLLRAACQEDDGAKEFVGKVLSSAKDYDIDLGAVDVEGLAYLAERISELGGESDKVAVLLETLCMERIVPLMRLDKNGHALETLTKLAKSGRASAQFALGRCYYLGSGVEKNKEEATKWVTRAAKQGHATANGFLYAFGLGVDEDLEKRIEWYRKGVEDDVNPLAAVNMGLSFQFGDGVEKDMEKAISCFTVAAEGGNATAMYKMAKCYEKGDGVEKDPAKALEWYRKGAEAGNADCMTRIGRCYATGDGVEEDEAKAVSWYQRGADFGNVVCMYYLAKCYDNGTGVEQDFKKSVELYRKGAEGGDSDCVYELGRCYNNGWGVEEDESEAVEWFRKGSENGHKGCICELGRCYNNGWGVQEDESEAVEWFRKGADKGHSGCMYELGQCYENGWGVAADKATAKEWYQKSADLGYKDAKEALEKLEAAE